MTQILIVHAVSTAICSLYTLILPCYDGWVRRRMKQTTVQLLTENAGRKAAARQRIAA